MISSFDDDSIYGLSYLSERFLEQPFFLGVNGLSGELVEGKYWKFSSNPALCSRYVCDNHNLEDTLVYFKHLIQHNFYVSGIPYESFDIVMSVMSDILNKIATEIVPQDSNIELETFMAAYNLIHVYNDIINDFFLLLFEEVTIEKLQQNFQINEVFFHRLSAYQYENPECSNKALQIIMASCENLRFTLLEVIDIVNHNDMKSTKTEILKNSDDLKFDELGDDLFFRKRIYEVTIEEDIINISTYTNGALIYFYSLLNELSDRDTYVKTFKYIDEISILDRHTLNNYKKLQQCLRDSDLSINMEEFRKMTKDFTKKYWERRSRRTEQDECFEFYSEETEFVFQFTTLVLEYLKRAPKDYSEFYKIVQENFTELGKILNSLRYMEIHYGTTLKISAILSQTLEELVTDPSVYRFIKEMPALLMNVTTKITYFQAKGGCHDTEFLSTIDFHDFPPFLLTKAKSIEDVNQISKIRRSKWKKVLGDNTTLDNCDQFYYRDTCPVCRNEQKRDHCCFLICKHTICSSCMQRILDYNEIPRCPVCRYPLSEFLPSGKLADICRDLQ